MRTRFFVIFGVALIAGLIPTMVSATNTGVDTGFGPDSGHYRYNREPYSEMVQDAAIDSQGRILLAFYIRDDSGSDIVYWPAVIRLNSDGSPDLSFGFLSIWLESTRDMTPEQPIAIAVDSLDRPIVGWTYEFSQGVPPNEVTNRDIWIRRLTSSGITDIGNVLAFDLGQTSGETYYDRLDNLKDITVISGDRVVAVGEGQYDGSDWDFIIGVFKPTASDGLELDTSFDSDGRRSVSFDLSGSSKYDGAEAVIIDSTNNIVVVGTSHSSSGTLVSACRLNSSDGSLDSSFDTDGRATYAYEPTVDPSMISRGVAVTSVTGGVVIGARLSPDNTNWQIGALKVQTDGSVDINFGNGPLGAMGWYVLDPAYPGQPWTTASTTLTGVVTDYDRLVFSGSITDPLDSAQGMGIVVVTDLDGNPDSDFVTGGYDFYSFEPDGEAKNTIFGTVLVPGAGVSLFRVGKVLLAGAMLGTTGGGSRTDLDIMATEVYTEGLIFSDGFESGGFTAWDSVSGAP